MKRRGFLAALATIVVTPSLLTRVRPTLPTDVVIDGDRYISSAGVDRFAREKDFWMDDYQVQSYHLVHRSAQMWNGVLSR